MVMHESVSRIRVRHGNIYIMEGHLRVTHIRASHLMTRPVREMHARARHERHVRQGM
jgi:hypothetical protein